MGVIQLAFDMSLDPIYRWENFYISPSNDEAISWIQRWPRWDTRALLIYGPKESGKTHMAHLWRTESRACFVDEATIKSEHLAEYVAQNPFLIFDNADRIQNKQNLLHLYNLVHECQGYLLLTAEKPPKQWHIDLADLRSRLHSIPSVEIKPPDDDLLQALLIKRFSDLQLRVPENVLAYLVKHIERSYQAVKKVSMLIDQSSLEQKRNLTLPLVRQDLENQ